MRESTRIVATWFGLLAGLAGLEHGYFEILQGNQKTPGIMFSSWGPPCVPEEIWHACEPAMSLLPSLLISGIVTVFLTLIIIVWSVGFVHQANGGLILLLLSIVLLLCGGGFFPPLIGIVGGADGMKINKPVLQNQAHARLRSVAKIWPWPLVVFVLWSVGQFAVGYFFNDFLKSNMGFSLLLILGSLPLSVYAAYAYDATMQIEGL